MNFNGSNFLHYLQRSGIGFWLSVLALVWLLGSLGLQGVVNSILLILAFLLVAPVIAFVGLRWWLDRNLATDNCPACNYEFVGLERSQFRCPNCGEPLQVEGGKFQRVAPPGTIDVDVVDVVDVPSRTLDSGD